MRRLKILTWHVHGSYLDALTSVEHDWYLPVVDGKYGGRRWSSPPWVHEIPGDNIKDHDFDLIVYQSVKNWQADQYEILSPDQRRLPRIYLEHNVPRPHAADTRTPVDDPWVLIVHVTHYNELMWDNGPNHTVVIEHTVAIDPAVRYTGTLERGITAINGMQGRSRIVGLDIFETLRRRVPLDAAGIDTERFGGLGDIPYRFLHARIAAYRFYFSPVRYTSLPLAVVEAMTIGMPVVAIATTEIPTVIRDGDNGFLSCDPDVLERRMRELLADRDLARRLGDNARRTAEQRFGMPRFVDDWNRAFERAIDLSRVAV